MIRMFSVKSKAAAALIDPPESETAVEVRRTVENIIADVRRWGDEAVREYNKRFDRCLETNLRVSQNEIDAAFDATDAHIKGVMQRAADNIRLYHERQRRQGFEIQQEGGIVLGQRILPLRRVGVYVPGGTASYPSTVLMNVIPAVVAGVDEIVLISPPNEGGSVRSEILAAAKIAGVTEVYRVGGAQGIAALSYGTKTIRRVDKIVGPGNAYVAEAKRQVYGTVDIDMIAGPSEILIIADSSANPEFLAADMLSQAEHDRMARAILVTADRKLALKTAEILDRKVDKLPRRDIARAAIDGGSAIVITDSLEQAFGFSDAVAPEHLELATADPFADLAKVRNAGSIFLGHYTPEPLGDYYAGPNHTLPTSGTARFSSPLSVDDFIKKNSYLYYPQDMLRRVALDVASFADSEGLTAHGDSVRVRLGSDKEDK